MTKPQIPKLLDTIEVQQTYVTSDGATHDTYEEAAQYTIAQLIRARVVEHSPKGPDFDMEQFIIWLLYDEEMLELLTTYHQYIPPEETEPDPTPTPTSTKAEPISINHFRQMLESKGHDKL